MNISSLSYNFDQLHILLSKINISFDVIRVAEIRFNLEHTPTEASCGGSLLYVKNKLNYFSRKDLNIYKKNELESTFIEILTSSGKIIIAGYI